MKFDDTPADQSAKKRGAVSLPRSVETGAEVVCDDGIDNGIGPKNQILLRLAGESDLDEDLRAADAHRTVPFLNNRIGASESAADWEGITLGRFRLEREIARGGMGIIFAAP